MDVLYFEICGRKVLFLDGISMWEERGVEIMLYALRWTTPCAWMSESVRASCCARGRTSRSVRCRLLLMIKSRSDWDGSWLLSFALSVSVVDRGAMIDYGQSVKLVKADKMTSLDKIANERMSQITSWQRTRKG
jgi:hypothetical protein